MHAGRQRSKRPQHAMAAARGSGTNEGVSRVTERTPHRPTIHNIPSRQVESGPWILWRKGRDAAVSAPWGVGGRAKGGRARGRRTHTNCKLPKMWRGEIDSSHVGSYNEPREISHPAPSGFVSWQRLQTVRNLKLWLLHDGHRQSPSIRDGGGGGACASGLVGRVNFNPRNGKQTDVDTHDTNNELERCRREGQRWERTGGKAPGRLILCGTRSPPPPYLTGKREGEIVRRKSQPPCQFDANLGGRKLGRGEVHQTIGKRSGGPSPTHDTTTCLMYSDLLTTRPPHTLPDRNTFCYFW